MAAADASGADHPPARHRTLHPAGEAQAPAAADALAVRVQPGELSAAGALELAPFRLHRGACPRKRPPSPRDPVSCGRSAAGVISSRQALKSLFLRVLRVLRSSS